MRGDKKGMMKMKKKKILVVTTQVPFISGGAEYLHRGFVEHLRRRGYEVDSFLIMEKWTPYFLPKWIFQARFIDLNQLPVFPDIVLALKFPSYLVNHPQKIVYFLHHFRVFYDLWNAPLVKFPRTREILAMREMLIKIDTMALREARRLYTQSFNVAGRLKRFNNVEAQVVYPPINDAHLFFSEEPENYLLFPSRLGILKRQDLAIRAIKFVKSPVKMLFAGKPDDENYWRQLNQLVQEEGVGDRVKFLGMTPRSTLIELYARALGVLFLPYDEDYGFVTLEAMYARKPVITCKDSGGPTEFVEDEETGFVTDPDPESIAMAIERLFENKHKAVQMGERGYEKIKAMDLSWDKVIDKVLEGF